MKKNLCILLALALAMVVFSACGKTETAPIAGTDEDGQNPVMNFVGNYQSDRRSMLVEAKGMDEAKVTVRWGSSAWEHAEWTMTGKIVEEGDGLIMQYTDGAYATVQTDEDGAETRSDEKDGLTGTVWFNADNTITWTDDQNEQIRDLVFEWVPVVSEEEVYNASPVVGTWSDGDDTEYAFNADGSGTVTHVKEDVGVPFQYELDEENGKIVFHMGSADDSTSAKYSMADETHLTLAYESGKTVELSAAD